MHDFAARPALKRRELAHLVLRWALGIAVFLAGMMLLAASLREPLESLGKSFVARFGYAGMALGTFLADGFHFPVPPQFYMLLAVSSGSSDLVSLATIAAGSLPGGLVGYVAGKRLARFAVVSRKLERSTAFVERSFERFGYGAALLASFSPVPYSVLCALSGAHRLEWRFFALLSACRLPRLGIYYWIVHASWHAT